MNCKNGLRGCAANAFAVTSLLACADHGTAAEAKRPIEGIADNSFLVEEAYNQEAGVVQHIYTAFYNVTRRRGPDDHNWDTAFTQEWPVFSQTHQFSYTLPFSFLDTGGRHENGIGDVLLNYRWQAFFREETMTALAPRLSLILPTGNEHRGLGEGSLGFQWNLPFSTAIADNWSVNLNAGGTFLSDPASTGGRSVYHHNIGASLIYAVNSEWHLMLEAVSNWEDVLNARGRRDYDFSALVAPGVRKAFNLANDAQLVLGASVPFGVGGPAPDYGVFLYVSFEHFFTRHE
jgi:hypothetical protein